MNIDRILTFQGNAQQNIRGRHFARVCAEDTLADDDNYCVHGSF
jgi:hypothetical protein